MIPRASVIAWRAEGGAPWAFDEQVEQDLVISRALVEIYRDPLLSANLAFRGGTALHKLCFRPAERYSEDIDLVQVQASPIGPTLTRLREVLDPWLGEPKVKRNLRMTSLKYSFQTDTQPPVTKRLKVEIHCREHLAFDGLQRVHFEVGSSWFRGAADVTTFSLEELLATKVRALLSRRKGRDAFDLDLAFRLPSAPRPARVTELFQTYMAHEGRVVSRAEFEMSIAEKAGDPAFLRDMDGLVSVGAPRYEALAGLRRVEAAICVHLPGAPWAGHGPTSADGAK